MRYLITVILALSFVSVASAGWPLSPTSEQHPIRGGFLDPRGPGDLELGESYKGFHKGLDIAAREDKPRAVYTISPGVVWGIGGRANCSHVRVGYFGYGHIMLSKSVRNGQRLPEGRVIGHTCPGIGLWHVHISEFTRKQVPRAQFRYRNPLAPGSRFRRWASYKDTEPPVIQEMATDANGTYIKIADRLSYQGWFAEYPSLQNEVHPYRLYVNGVLRWRVLRPPPDSTFWTHYDFRTRKNWR